MATLEPASKRFSTDKVPKLSGTLGVQVTVPSGTEGAKRSRAVRRSQNGDADAQACGEHEAG
jgi:hypothetical protein